jgi:hypothetical protein
MLVVAQVTELVAQTHLVLVELLKELLVQLIQAQAQVEIILLMAVQELLFFLYQQQITLVLQQAPLL